MKVAISTMSPYSYSLIKALETQNIFAKSLNPWGKREGLVEKIYQNGFNILHIQWPEALLSIEERNNLSIGIINKFEEELKSIKSHAGIVFTFHNKIPHENIKPAEEKKLYESVIRNADIIIHHSKMGKKIVNSFYNIERAKKQVVLRHPPYYYYKENNLDKSTVRSHLNIPKDALCIGIIGNISPYKQIDLFIDYLVKSKLNNIYLLVAGQINDLNYGKVIQNKILSLKEMGINVITKYEWLSNAEIAFYAAASDALFCGNSNNKITSGIPHLAEMAGKAIFGYENYYLKEVANKYSLFISDAVRYYNQNELLERFSILGNAAAKAGEQWNPGYFGNSLLKIYQYHKNE